MKKCPYCAEEIQDEAIKCRHCYSDLTVPREEALKQAPSVEVASSQPSAGPSPSTELSPSAGPSPASGFEPPPMGAGEVRYSHSGYRYVLGYGADYFGIWDRQSPAAPSERFPRTDDGWRQAWIRFASLEPRNVQVPQEQSTGAAPGAVMAPAGVEPAPAMDPTDVTAVRYTHSGSRYLLGYGRTFFGIWDRQSPAEPAERFPRTDDGWSQAWRRYGQIETNFVEVKS